MVGKAKKKTSEKLDDQITENCLKDILMHGKKSDSSVVIQIVHLNKIGKKLEIELSDKSIKTRPLKIILPKSESLSLYSIVKIKYDVVPVNRMTTDIAERYELTIKSLKVIDSSSKKVCGHPQYIAKSLYPDLHTLEEDYIDNEYCAPLNKDSHLALPGTSKNVLEPKSPPKMEFPSTPKRPNTVTKPRTLIFPNSCEDTFMEQMEMENVTPIKLVAHIPPTKMEEIQTTSKPIIPTAPSELEVRAKAGNESSGFFSEEDTFCSLIPDTLLNKSFSPAELREFKQNQTLLNFLKRDLILYQNEAQAKLKDKTTLVMQVHSLQKRKREIEKNMSSAENEILAIDSELVPIEKTVKEMESELKSLLEPASENSE